MPKLPHPDDELSPEREAESMFIEVAVDATPEIKEHIRHADYWSADWRLRELEFEREPRRAEHQKYVSALHKVCRDYSNQVLDEFPLGVARWLAQEADNVCAELPSQILKHPNEGVQTANFAQKNQFELLRDEWERQKHNPAFILQALSRARELNVFPPDWVLEALVEAGAKVYESDGDIEFGEALGLTPKKIKEARSGQKKVWVADLVAEAIDAGLTPTEARELAIFEAEIVFGWPRYATGTVQKYYEQHTQERDGFSRSFMYSFEWYELDSDPVYKSIYLPLWRRNSLKARLEAYRESIELYRDADDVMIDRKQRLGHVTSKTLAALRRSEPPKTKQGM